MEKPRKVLLITPPYHSGVVEAAGTWLNVGFVYIAGSLRAAGYEPDIYDAMSLRHDYADIEKRITDFKPHVVATTAFTAEVVEALKVLSLAKKINPEIITVIGNVHPTFCYEEMLRDNHGFLDYIIRGEGERTLPMLLDALGAGADVSKIKGTAFHENGRTVVTGFSDYIDNLDELPMAWDLIEWPIYKYKPMEHSVLAIVSSSRGCVQQCAFCSQQLFWNRRWRARSPEGFIAELELLRDRYGVNVVMLADETPTLSRRRWERILELKIERGLETKLLLETRVDDILRDEDIMWKYSKAGVDHIYVGVESVSQETLDIFNKNIKVEDSKKALDLINAHDIVSETSLVLGMPEDTTESIKRSVELARHYNPDLAFFLAIAPWPYADMYDKLKPYLQVFDYSRYNLVEPVLKPRDMTLDEVRDALGSASRDFYMHKLETLDSMSARKREFMIKVVRLIAEDSYLASDMKGAIPEEVKRVLKKANIITP
jgi:anaerobic magnesium-protoporphyrin IX monomethyl ester cyclase